MFTKISFFSYKKIISFFIKILQFNCNKAKSEIVLYHLLNLLKKKLNLNPFYILITVFETIKPFCEIKNLTIFGIIYKIPVEIKFNRQKFLLLKWLLIFSKNKVDFNISYHISNEIVNLYKNTGLTFKKCQEFNKINELNKIYIYTKI